MGRTVDLDKLKDEIAGVLHKINELRLVRQSYQIGFLVDLIVPALKSGAVSKDVVKHIVQLEDVANEVGLRLHGSTFEHVAELCDRLIEVAESIAGDPAAPNKRDIELLTPLSQAILAGFNPERAETEMATEISSMVHKFEERTKTDKQRARIAKRRAELEAGERADKLARAVAHEAARDREIEEKSKTRRATDRAAIDKAKAKSDAERQAQKDALPIEVTHSKTPRDLDDWKKGRAKARKRDIRSSSRG